MSGEMLFGGTTSDAVLSNDGQYRYSLTRTWGDTARAATFIMLNPSTADAREDDPTIRRCIGFAKTWGLDGLTVVNLYAYRATKPADLWRTDDPIGPDCDTHIALWLAQASIQDTPVVAAWGAHAAPLRAEHVRHMARRFNVPLLHLGLTKAGQPRHPLYLRADTEPKPFPEAAR